MGLSLRINSFINLCTPQGKWSPNPFALSFVYFYYICGGGINGSTHLSKGFLIMFQENTWECSII